MLLRAFNQKMKIREIKVLLKVLCKPIDDLSNKNARGKGIFFDGKTGARTNSKIQIGPTGSNLK
jgi:hypothetical protein